MGGCTSKTVAKKVGATVAHVDREAAIDAPIVSPAPSLLIATRSEEKPTLTRGSAEERALTQLKTLFESIDANRDGHVSTAELAAALAKDASLGALIKEAGLHRDYNPLEKLQTNANGRITWQEFLLNLKKQAVEEIVERGYVSAAELPASEKALQQLRKIFESLDSNADGSVSSAELADGLSKDASIGKLVEEAGFNPDFYVLEQLDTNHDGHVTWEEFEAHLCRAANKEVRDQGNVIAALVLEQPEPRSGDAQEEELNQEVEAIVAPKGFFCC